MSSNYLHHEMFALGEDSASYRLLTRDHVGTRRLDGREILEVDTGALTLLADQAMRDRQHCCDRATSRSCARSSTIRKPRPTTASSPSSCSRTPASPRPASCPLPGHRNSVGRGG